MHWSTDVYHAPEYQYGNLRRLPKTSYLWILSVSMCRSTEFQARKVFTEFARNLLFLYLTNKFEFEQDILQGCVSSYHLHV